MSRLILFARRHWPWGVPVLAALIGVGIWLVFFHFAVHLIFIDDKVDEAPPVFASGAGASGLPSDAISEDLADDMNEVMADENIPTEVTVDEGMPMTDASTGETPSVETPAEGQSGTPAEAPASETNTPQVITSHRGDFISRSHPTEGNATVLTDGIQRFLRFEDFRTDNGPDLNVYLSSAAPDQPSGDFDDDFVDLGDLKGNIGPQNYEIPEDVDLDRYSTVVIWCVRFSVIFGAAQLNSG